MCYLFYFCTSNIMANNPTQKLQELLAGCTANQLHGCLIWSGTKYRVHRNQNDPKISFRFEHRHYSITLHSYVYKVTKGIPPHKSIDCISHLCHKPLCLNINHLHQESMRVNNIRRNCKRVGQCIGHPGHPNCII
jgi:hypothetical protein